MVFVENREEKGKDESQSDVPTRSRARQSVENRKAKDKESRKLPGMPALDDREPTVAPEDGESTERRVIREDIRGNPGEEVMRQDHRAGSARDQAAPRQRAENRTRREGSAGDLRAW
jgi:hypothetical protein